MTGNGDDAPEIGVPLAVVTGAASGIGKAVASALVANGARVIGIDINPEELARSALGGGFEPLAVDIATHSGVQAIGSMLVSHGAPTTLVHAAGVSRPGTSISIADSDWDDVIRVNLTAVVQLNKAIAPLMNPGANNSIVMVGSQLGLVGTINSLAYSASKGAIVNLTRSTALELAPLEIRVNCVCPGPTETPFLERSFMRTGDPDTARGEALSKVPLGRFAQASEVAAVVVFLTTTGASYITGAVIPVDGGYIAQ